MWESCFSMGMACSRSSALPCGTPSMMSISTTSQCSFDAIQCAAVAPTFPEPTTVTFFRIVNHSIRCLVSVSCTISLMRRFISPAGARFNTVCLFLFRRQLRDGLHIVDHMRRKLASLDLGRALQHTFEVVRDLLLQDGVFHRAFDQPCCFVPAHEIEHHDARQNHRSRIDDVLVGVLWSCPVRGLENRMLVADVGTRRYAESSYL